MTNNATRWTVKGWDDEHIEYEDEEGKWVAWEDHRDILQAAVAAAYEDAAQIAFDLIMEEARRVDTPEAQDALEDVADDCLGIRARTRGEPE